MQYAGSGVNIGEVDADVISGGFVKYWSQTDPFAAVRFSDRTQREPVGMQRKFQTAGQS